MKIGFIGLGIMGGHMARHLAAQHEIVVFDVDGAKIDAVAGAPDSTAGTRGAASIAELGEECDLVLLSLPSSAIVEAVAIGDGGLAGSMVGGSLVVDTSTTEPTVTARVAAALAERGIGFIDAPVSGGEGGAKAASLSIMAGGPEELVERARPVLEVIGSSVVRVGDVGAGEVAKLVNNMIVGSTFAVVAESFALGRTMGLDPKVLYEAIRGGWAGSAVLDVAAPGIAERNFTPGGSVDVLFKDIGYALSLAREKNVPTPMTALVDEIFKAARASGRGPKAQQVIIQLWEELLGLE
ncbi:MAG: NAD(P)-dependent oxidoreductase [Spirochaetota bacterium]